MPVQYAYSDPTGHVWIITGATPDNRVMPDGSTLTPEEYEAAVRASIPDTAVEIVKLPDDWQRPGDITTRGRWRIVNGEVIITQEP